MNNISKNILSVFAAVAAVTASGAEAVKSVVPFEVKKELETYTSDNRVILLAKSKSKLNKNCLSLLFFHKN